MNVRERFRPVPMAADTSTETPGTAIGGFLAKTSGTITMTDADGTVLVDAVPVTAGIFTPLPFIFKTSAGGEITLGGGASGTLGV